MADTVHAVLRFEGYVLDLARRVLLRGRKTVELRPKSFDVLACLARNAGRLVTKDELMATVWPGVVVTEESLTRCVSDIRAALDDGAQQLVKTVPRRGYVFAAPICRVVVRERERPSRWTAWALAASVLLGVGAGAWYAGVPSDSHVPSLSIVVLPLNSRTGDRDQQYLAEAVTEEITVDLSRIPDSFVIGRSTADTYRGRSVDARQVGSELGVRYVLEGSLHRIGDELQLSVQLIDAASGRTLWAERFDGEVRDLPALHRRITGTVAQSLHLRLAAAAHLYLGRDAEALAWARKATSANPNFTIAHSWVASAAASVGDMDTASTGLAEFRRQRPDYTIALLRKEGLCANVACREQRERYYAGLAKAGLPQ